MQKPHAFSDFGVIDVFMLFVVVMPRDDHQVRPVSVVVTSLVATNLKLPNLSDFTSNLTHTSDAVSTSNVTSRRTGGERPKGKSAQSGNCGTLCAKGCSIPNPVSLNYASWVDAFISPGDSTDFEALLHSYQSTCQRS